MLENRMAAETDPLSGLVNRRGFDLRAGQLLMRAREEGWPACVLLLDLDHFKQVNDRHGHAAGDAAIAIFGAMLQRTVPQSSIVARLGGEEFVVLLERTTLETARLQAEILRQATLTCHQDGIRQGVPPFSVSIGVAEMRAPHDLRSAMSRADAMLYIAKAEGRNRVVCTGELHSDKSL